MYIKLLTVFYITQIVVFTGSLVLVTTRSEWSTITRIKIYCYIPFDDYITVTKVVADQKLNLDGGGGGGGGGRGGGA